MHHQGGGKLRRYTHVDIYKRMNLIGEILRIYKVGERSGFIAMVIYVNGMVSNIIATEQIYLYSTIFNGAYPPAEYNQDTSYG